MTDPRSQPAGTFSWMDLTVSDAEAVRDFYASVVGWTPADVPMGGYADFMMKAPGGDAVAGVCHARGQNAGLPAQWLVYVLVDDIAASRERCVALGGTLLTDVRGAGEGGAGGYCVIRDPAGAVLALMQRVAG